MTAAGTSPPVEAGALVGHVRAVAVYPLKGAGGGPVEEVALDRDGVVGDRRHVVLDDHAAVLTAYRAPLLRSVVARLDGGTLRLDVDGAEEGLAGTAAETALAALLGRPATLGAAGPGTGAGSQLEAPVHLVSVQSVEAARRGEHEAADCACSLEEPRANLVLDLADAAGREAGLVGCTVSAGSAVLRVHRRPGHCLGVYAEVVRAGRIAVGDAVHALGS